jgi:type IV pilus assembly protein PilE
MDKIEKNISPEAGFSLTEILIVLAIIGILILLAIPNFKPLISRVKATEARDQLRYARMLQESYFLEHDRYGTALSEIGFSPRPLITEGGEARYRIAIERADAKGYEISATAVVDFDGDGRFNKWIVDESGKIREIIPD